MSRSKFQQFLLPSTGSYTITPPSYYHSQLVSLFFFVCLLIGFFLLFVFICFSLFLCCFVVFCFVFFLVGNYSRPIGPKALTFSGYDGNHLGHVITKFGEKKFFFSNFSLKTEHEGRNLSGFDGVTLR